MRTNQEGGHHLTRPTVDGVKTTSKETCALAGSKTEEGIIAKGSLSRIPLGTGCGFAVRPASWECLDTLCEACGTGVTIPASAGSDASRASASLADMVAFGNGSTDDESVPNADGDGSELDFVTATDPGNGDSSQWTLRSFVASFITVKHARPVLSRVRARGPGSTIVRRAKGGLRSQRTRVQSM